MSNNLATSRVTGLTSGKEAVIDDALDAFDAILTEKFDADVVAGNVVLTNSQYRRNSLISIINAGTAGRSLTVPAIRRGIFIRHFSGANAVDLKRGTTTISLAPGNIYWVYTDGTANDLNAVQVTAVTASVVFGTIIDKTVDYTLILGDAFGHVRMNKATAINLTVPPNASVAFPIGTRIFGDTIGVGALTIVPGVAVTVNSANTLVSPAQFSHFLLVKEATNTWSLAWFGEPSANAVSFTNAGKPSAATNTGLPILVTDYLGGVIAVSDGTDWVVGVDTFIYALSDETSALTTGTAKLTARAPYKAKIVDIRANVNTVSSSGLPTVDINVGGATILSTKLTIDASEKTSKTAATPYVASSVALADDDEMTFDVDVAGTGTKGLKVHITMKHIL